jgi:hypothetical protein
MKTKKSTSDYNYEYILLVNKLRNFLQSLVELHKAKLNSKDF